MYWVDLHSVVCWCCLFFVIFKFFHHCIICIIDIMLKSLSLLAVSCSKCIFTCIINTLSQNNRITASFFIIVVSLKVVLNYDYHRCLVFKVHHFCIINILVLRLLHYCIVFRLSVNLQTLYFSTIIITSLRSRCITLALSILCPEIIALLHYLALLTKFSKCITISIIQ